MIFEATYKEVEKPFLYMRSLLSESDFKSEKHPVTIDVTEEEVFFYFYDVKSKTEFSYHLKDATASLDGAVTCSMKALYDILKTFKKSEDVILIEREENFLRIDDGVFPEEILVLYDDEEIVVTEIAEVESIEPLTFVNSKKLSEALLRASVILKKTDIPSSTIDTQGILLSGTADKHLTTNVFAIHNYYSESFESDIQKEFSIQIPKSSASLLSRILLASSKNDTSIHISQGHLGGQELLLIEDEKENMKMTLKGSFETSHYTKLAMDETLKNIEALFATNEATKLSSTSLPGKISAHTNLILKESIFAESQYGYQGKIIKDFIQKEAISSNSEWFELESDKILILRDVETGSKKTMVLSYRTEPTA